ncbi:TIR domain-containing protein [Aliarcobacter cryaerophilus]|uniref:TIR domain-containing protein n=1 Tax=Aliarcobacter cryaerophilus TaxID=28198 RepID=UPI001C641843|nr:nucleotide-binding protein [Aliarcobacter cryaerophilus]
MEEFIEIFIKNKANEIPDKYTKRINKFLPFYTTIQNDDLAYLFAYLHFSYNSLFEFLNNKISVNRHYNADASRELIFVIDLYNKLHKSLNKTKYEFILDKKYLEILNICETFLSSSGGSSIPEDFLKIDIIEIRPIFRLINFSESPEIISENVKTNLQSEKMVKEKNKVFIVHGHDNETKQEVARFIESIGLETIILHEQASRSMTIIEKIEHYSCEANFAIVLYTPCDKGRGVKETKVPARDRARQNVVFEHGYLMAKIGRENVCALVKGEIETPSDISGVVYTPLDSNGGWKIELTKELKACGYKVRQ